MSGRGLRIPVRSRRSCGGQAWRWSALLLAAHCASFFPRGVAAVAAVGPAGSGRIELHTGAKYLDRTWESGAGSNGASQFFMPLDLVWRARTVRISAGADWSRGASELAGETTTAVYPSEVRASSEIGFFRDRLRLAGGVRQPFFDAGLTPEEVLTASLLDEATLAFARTRHPGGRSLVLEAGGQPLRREGIALQTGLSWEHRGSYEFLIGGRRLDPGDPWRLGLGVVAGRGALLGDLGLRWEKAGRTSLGGGFGYREGNAITVQAGLLRQRERGRVGVAASLTARSAGTVDAEAPLDRSALRGGNAGRLTVTGTRRTRAGEIAMSLGLAGVRGYYGDLGHADALQPGLTWSRGLAGGRMGVAAHGVYGRCRGDRPLRGFGFSISWSGEWRR